MKKILLIVLWFNFIGVNAFTGEAFVNALRWFKYCPYCGAERVSKDGEKG